MVNISGIIIVKDGESLIKDCLNSIKFCDEVIVVDAGSTDQTVEIAANFGAICITGDESDFAEQRNLGLKRASGKWILYIDVDERVSIELQDAIKKVISSGDTDRFAAYKIWRKNYYFGNHPWPNIELIERFFKKEYIKGWKGQLHESPDVTGSYGVLEGLLMHYSHRDLASMLAKTDDWSEIEAKLRLQAHHPPMTWWRFYRVMATAFYQSYCSQGGWKVGIVGIIESMYQAFSLFITYAKLWEMQQQ